MNINRDYYLNKLINARGIGMIKILTGVRRCGKSYLLNTISARCQNISLLTPASAIPFCNSGKWTRDI